LLLQYRTDFKGSTVFFKAYGMYEGSAYESVIPIKDNDGLMSLWLFLWRKPHFGLSELTQELVSNLV
jgi:hypothetical protein